MNIQIIEIDTASESDFDRPAMPLIFDRLPVLAFSRIGPLPRRLLREQKNKRRMALTECRAAADD
jgi:hypothetical protein